MARRRHKNFQQISAFSLTLCSKRHTSNMAAWFHLYGVTAPHVHRTSDHYKRLAAHIFDWLYMVKNVQQSAGDRLEVDVPSIGRRLLHRTVRTFHPAQPHTHTHTYTQTVRSFLNNPTMNESQKRSGRNHRIRHIMTS